MIPVTRSTILTVGAAMVLTATLAAGVTAQGGRPGRPGPGGPGGRGGPGGPMGPGLPIAQLGLTDDQQTQLRDVMGRYREEMHAVSERLRTAHEAQRHAIEAVPLNERLIRSTSDVLGGAETEMAILQGRIHNDVFALLTPEQQAKAKQISAQRASRMKQRQDQFKNRLQKRQNQQ